MISTGLNFTSKKILKFAIVLLGASLSISTILQVGKMSLAVMVFTLLPWFILAFVGVAIINSLGVIPSAVSGALKNISKFLMVAALAAIGMNTDFKEMKKSGINPMIHGFIISALVVVVALAVEYFLLHKLKNSIFSI